MRSCYGPCCFRDALTAPKADSPPITPIATQIQVLDGSKGFSSETTDGIALSAPQFVGAYGNALIIVDTGSSSAPATPVPVAA